MLPFSVTVFFSVPFADFFHHSKILFANAVVCLEMQERWLKYVELHMILIFMPKLNVSTAACPFQNYLVPKQISH
jgi:hypothetical protein